MKKIILSLLLLLARAKSINAKGKKNTAIIPVPNTEENHYDYQERHSHILDQQTQLGNHDLVFLGDSITHFFGGAVDEDVGDDYDEVEIDTGGEVWEEYYGDDTRYSTMNIGFGWDRTQNVLWRLNHGELKGQTPKVCVILIGTNNLQITDSFPVANTPQEIVQGIMAVTAKVHSITPQTKILLLGILPREDLTLFQQVQEINAQLQFHQKLPDYITFLDMTLQFTDSHGNLNPKLYRKDGVHPNAIGYSVWAKTMEPILQKLMADDGGDDDGDDENDNDGSPESRRQLLLRTSRVATAI